MAKKIDIGGELNSTALDKKLVDAAQVKDSSRGEKTLVETNEEIEYLLAQEGERQKQFEANEAARQAEADKTEQDRADEAARTEAERQATFEANEAERQVLYEKVEKNTEGIEFLNANTGVSEYPEFSEAKAYAVGEVVLYEGLLKRFISAHEAGAWDASQVESWSERKESKEKFSELGSVAEHIETELYELDTKILGNYKEVLVSSERYFDGARIMYPSDSGYLTIGTSEISSVAFYPIEKGKRYKIKSRYASKTSGYWGYCNELPSEIDSTINFIGKNGEDNIGVVMYEKTIIAEDYSYIVISAPKNSFTDGVAALFYLNPDERKGGVINEKVEAVNNSLKNTDEKVEDLMSVVEGEKTGDVEEVEVEKNKMIYDARIEANKPLSELVLNTSTTSSIAFYPIEKGCKYRVKSLFVSVSNPHFGFSNMIVDEVTEQINIEGEILAEGISNSEVQDFDYTFINDTDYKYLVISSRTTSFSAGTSGLTVFKDKRLGGINQEVVDIKYLSANNTQRIEKVENEIFGTPTKKYISLTAIRLVEKMMIKRPDVETDYLPLSTSSGCTLMYYNIKPGASYKLNVSNKTASTSYWGYANEIKDSLDVVYPDVEPAEGKCIELTTPSSSEALFEKEIEQAENYIYIVLCTTNTQGSSLSEIVDSYDGGIKKQVEENKKTIEGCERSLSFDIAFGTMDESCLTDDDEKYYVRTESIVGKKKSAAKYDNIVAIAHDDLPYSDLFATRKIYNKYGFTAGFNYVLNPFTDKSDKEIRIENTKKMIVDGHEIGFHAIFGASFFWRNPMYDVTPNSSATFAPLLDDMKTDVGGGKNIFGKNITSATTFSDYGYSGNTSTTEITINAATNEQWFDAHKYYTIYGTTIAKQGLDLEDNIVTKTMLQWLEYWYNELIDDSLGYSKYDGTIAERFAEDYEGDYPSAEMITSGNLSSSGRFVKGLFKGCHSCCNYEVIDRIIRIAEAFSRKYFGLSKFTNMAYHGAIYVNLFWNDENGTLYNDRNKTILATGHTKLFISTKNKYMNLFDIALSHGIKMIKRLYPADPTRVEGQIGLFKGQLPVRGAYFNDLSRYHINDYLALISKTSATSSGMELITYEELAQYAPNQVDDWFKWAYENAGRDMSGNGAMYMLSKFKSAIDVIKTANGTGKIPFLGVDTIVKSASISAAIEMFCQFCYRHNILVVSPSQAMDIANENRMVNNAFPNPTFTRSVLEDCGGESIANSAYIPDGWYSATDIKPNVYKDGNDKVLSITSGALQSRIYGLPSGKYRFTAMAKSDNSNNDTVIYFAKKLNGAKVADNNDVVGQRWLVVGNGEYAEVTYEFVIEEPHRNEVDGTLANTLCNGYEDNVNHVVIKLIAASGDTLSVMNPRIEKIEL